MNIHTATQISASAEQAWEVLGEKFAEIGEWSTAVQSSSIQGELGVGAIRACQSKGFGPFSAGIFEEKLTHFSHQQRCFTYVGHSGLPAFIETAQNTWSVEVVSEKQCIVHSQAKLELSFWLRPLGLILPLLIKNDMKKFGEEMRYRIENGLPHPRKLAALMKAVQL